MEQRSDFGERCVAQAGSCSPTAAATYARATGDVAVVTNGSVLSAADAREALIAHTVGERPEVWAAVAS